MCQHRCVDHLFIFILTPRIEVDSLVFLYIYCLSNFLTFLFFGACIDKCKGLIS